MNVQQEWTLLGRSKVDVEKALVAANYFEKSRKLWAPRGSSKVMDNIMPMFDSTGTLLGISRALISTNFADGPALFQHESDQRKRILGEPITDTVIATYGDEERRIVWRIGDSDEPKLVSVSLLHQAGIIMTSYLVRSEKDMVNSMFPGLRK